MKMSTQFLFMNINNYYTCISMKCIFTVLQAQCTNVNKYSDEYFLLINQSEIYNMVKMRLV